MRVRSSEGGWKYRAYINGVPIWTCIEADEEGRWMVAVIANRMSNGEFSPIRVSGSPIYQFLFGEVKLRRIRA